MGILGSFQLAERFDIQYTIYFWTIRQFHWKNNLIFTYKL